MKNIILFLSIVVISACKETKTKITGNEGEILPSFKIMLPDNVSWMDTKDLKPGKQLLFFLFSPDCPYSKAQMSDIIKNINNLKDFKIFAITPYPFKQMKDFYRKYSLNNYPNIIVGTDPDNFFVKYMKATIAPFIAIYGKDKKLIKAFSGKTDLSIVNLE